MLIDQHALDAVKGFMDAEEGGALYSAALSASLRGPCLEIGSYCGKSAVYMGSACRENGAVLFSIDHHRGSEEQQPGQAYCDPDLIDPITGDVDTFRHFRNTLRVFSLEDTVVPLVCLSTVAAQAWTTPLAMVFIDGGHAFETVWNDYNGWAGHVMSGGLLAIHDVFEKPEDGGLSPFEVYEYAIASGLFEESRRVKSLRMLRRKSCRAPAPPRKYAY